MDDALHILKGVTEKIGINKTARMLGYSPAVISLVLKGKYAGDIEGVYRKVKEAFTVETVTCPVLGEITRRRCAEERKKKMLGTSPTRFALAKTCPLCKLWE